MNNVSIFQKIGLLLIIIISTISLKSISFSQNEEFSIENQRIIIIKAPESLGKLVENHVREILKKGYAKDINDKDFYHGHILRIPDKKHVYSSIDEFISKIEMILYHTDERTGRWELLIRQGKKRIPRSIIGKKGKVIPASMIFNQEGVKDFSWEDAAPFYLKYGTITSYDILKRLPYLDDGNCLGKDVKKPKIIINKRPFIISFQFKIQKDAKGRYSTPKENFEILMRLEREDWWLFYDIESR